MTTVTIDGVPVTPQNFGEWLTRFLHEKNLTRYAVGKATGISAGVLWNYQHHKSYPRQQRLVELVELITSVPSKETIATMPRHKPTPRAKRQAPPVGQNAAFAELGNTDKFYSILDDYAVRTWKKGYAQNLKEWESYLHRRGVA